MAIENNEVVGTLRCNYSKNLDSDDYTKLYQMETAGDAHPSQTSMSGRFMVKKTFRGGRIGWRLLRESYKQQLRDEIKFNFIDAEADLLPFFKKLGYQAIAFIDYPMYESSQLMVLDL